MPSETAESVYFTQYFEEVYPKDMYGVFEDGRLVAWCTNPEDAERLKALLVYYGAHFPTLAERVSHHGR